jgi:hypothetical protein
MLAVPFDVHPRGRVAPYHMRCLGKGRNAAPQRSGTILHGREAAGVAALARRP